MWAMMEKLRMWSMKPAAEQKKSTMRVPFCGAAILLDPGEARIQRRRIQVVVADLQVAVEEHRNLVAPLLLERGIAVHVENLHLEVVALLEVPQSREHFLAQM